MGIRKTAVALSLLASINLVGCAPAADSPDTTSGSSQTSTQRAIDEIFTDLGIDLADPKAMVEALDTLPVAERPTDLIASVLPTAVQLQPGQPDEITVPLESDEFYLSIAPYISQTHPCSFHSLTTCLGELQNTPIELTVTDTKTGDVVFSESTSTADNGFVGIWLPRNGEFSVSITSEGGTARQIVTTGGEDPTCLTTMQLS